MNRRRLAATVTIVMLVSVACAAAQRAPRPEPLELPEGEPYVHEASGMQFPPAVGEFKRRGGFRYDAEGRNVSVTYRLDAHKLAVTGYAYPAGGATLADHFEQVRRDLTTAYPDAELEKEAVWTLQQGGTKYVGRRATYTHTLDYAGEEQPVVQEVYLLKLGEHFIKFRVTYPVAERDGAGKALAVFHRDLKLPPPPARRHDA